MACISFYSWIKIHSDFGRLTLFHFILNRCMIPKIWPKFRASFQGWSADMSRWSPTIVWWDRMMTFHILNTAQSRSGLSTPCSWMWLDLFGHLVVEVNWAQNKQLKPAVHICGRGQSNSYWSPQLMWLSEVMLASHFRHLCISSGCLCSSLKGMTQLAATNSSPWVPVLASILLRRKCEDSRVSFEAEYHVLLAAFFCSVLSLSMLVPVEE